MRKFTNIERFSIKISILSESEKKVLKFKWLFYAQGTEVCLGLCLGLCNQLFLCKQVQINLEKSKQMLEK